MKINLSKLKSSKLVVSNFIKEIYRDLKMRAVRNRRRRDAVAEQRLLEERTLIVDDVHLLADETILKYIFQEIGEIRLIYYPTQKTDSVTAYVIYEDPSLAHFALRICNNIELFKQKIKVSSLIYKRDTSYDWLDDPAHDDVQSTSEYIKSHIAFKAMSYELKLWADSICELALRVNCLTNFLNILKKLAYFFFYFVYRENSLSAINHLRNRMLKVYLL